MNSGDKLIHIFSGPEIAVILLKGELEKQGIHCIIKNDYQAGISAGFFGGTPSAIELFVLEKDFQKAKEIIAEFEAANQ